MSVTALETFSPILKNSTSIPPPLPTRKKLKWRNCRHRIAFGSIEQKLQMQNRVSIFFISGDQNLFQRSSFGNPLSGFKTQYSRSETLPGHFKSQSFIFTYYFRFFEFFLENQLKNATISIVFLSLQLRTHHLVQRNQSQSSRQFSKRVVKNLEKFNKRKTHQCGQSLGLRSVTFTNVILW